MFSGQYEYANGEWAGTEALYNQLYSTSSYDFTYKGDQAKDFYKNLSSGYQMQLTNFYDRHGVVFSKGNPGIVTGDAGVLFMNSTSYYLEGQRMAVSIGGNGFGVQSVSLDVKDWFQIGLGATGFYYDVKGNALHNDLYWKGKTTGKIYTKNPFTRTKVGWKANSFKATGKAFQGAKSLGAKLGVAGLLVTGYDVVFGDGLTTSNILDATFGIAGFIPGVGWMISGSYFLLNTGVQLYSGKNIGEHLDE